MDSRNLSYNTSKQQTANGTIQYISQQPQQQSSCRHYSSTTDAEYHHPARSKSAASTDSAYSSNTSQNGPDCAVVVPRRPSPLQAHSQASPLGHVPSPATYPMYNSPMASMSSPSSLQQPLSDGSASTPYKTGNLQQQMTPPSPLDVSVTRSPSQQGQVGYSSVITRALGANENNKTSFSADGNHCFEYSAFFLFLGFDFVYNMMFIIVASSRSTYERSQDFSQSKQMCWDSESGQQAAGKFSSSNYLAPDGSESTVLASQQIQRILNVTDRSTCLESGQITLQDLSSCRAQPMSIVKNMPTLHSSGSSEHDNDERQDAEDHQHQPGIIGAKRKSLDKIGNELTSVVTVNNYNADRIPPPAHHNVVVNQQQHQQQQQQNGYLEFDRWNLTTVPHAKIITTPASAFGTQQLQSQHLAPQHHHSVNFVNNSLPHQHQSLLLQHHTTPTVSYFPTFHITSSGHHLTPLQPPQHPHQQHMHHPTHELPSTVDLNALRMTDLNSCQQNSSYAQTSMKDDRPQVIVPNIEEELGFLQQSELPGVPPVVTQQPIVNPEVKRVANNDPNSGFMTSYLKFLQGEKDSSPPLTSRGIKQSLVNALVI